MGKRERLERELGHLEGLVEGEGTMVCSSPFPGGFDLRIRMEDKEPLERVAEAFPEQGFRGPRIVRCVGPGRRTTKPPASRIKDPYGT